MRRGMTIPRVPTPVIALLVMVALGVIAVKLVAPLPDLVFWAAVLVLVAAGLLFARRRVGLRRAVELLAVGFGVFQLGGSLLIFLVFGGTPVALVGVCALAVIAGRRVYLVAARADHRLLEVSVLPPGLPLLGAVLASLACLSYGSSARWDGEDVLMAGIGLWLVAGILWLGKLFVTILRDGDAAIRRRPARWLIPPVLGVVGLLFPVSSIPLLVRFELSRPAIEDAARRVQAGEVRPNQEVSLGLFGEGSVRLGDDGSLEFYLGRDAGFGGDDYYLVWVPAGAQPPADMCFTWEHIERQGWLMNDDLWCEF
jgi:hypothetical protein